MRSFLPERLVTSAALCYFAVVNRRLLRIKEAAGRTKDREAIAELRVLLEESAKK